MKIRKKLLTVACLLSICTPLVAYATSSISETTVDVVTLANTPTKLQIDKEATTDKKLALSYESNGNPSNTYYSVDISLDEKEWETKQDKSLDKLKAEVSDLKANTKYFVRAYSFNQGSPQQTNGEFVTGNFLTKPAKPNAPKGSVTDQEIILTWDLIQDVIPKLFDNTNESMSIGTTDTSKKFEDLVPDTKYQFSLVHSNETGDSERSDMVELWTDAKIPTNLRASERSQDSITVTIDANGNPETTLYNLRIADIDGTTIKESGWLSGTSWTFKDLKPGQYKIFAKAKNNPLNPVAKETAEIELVSGTVPAAPEIELDSTEESITVKMKPTSNTDSIEFRLLLLNGASEEIAATEWAKNGEGWTAKEFTYAFVGLNPNEKYKVRAEARYVD